MFSVAYIKHFRDHGKTRNKWKSKSLKCIAIGKCDKSDGLLFYHPPSKQTYTCGDGYKFDSFSPSGPQFALPFDGCFTFSTESVMSGIHRPPTHEQDATIYVKMDENYIPCKVLSIPIDEESETYVIQAINSSDIYEIMSDDIYDHDPTADPSSLPTTDPFPHLPWLKHGTKATLYLSDHMQQPKQGKLLCKDGEWSFLLGRVDTNPTMPLPNFVELAESMINNRKLFQGWKAQKHVLAA
jgi:hypothetical protein